MYGKSNRAFVQRAVVFAVVCVVALIAYSMRTGGNNSYSLPTALTTKPPLTNAEVVQNWLPQDSYNYTLARIYNYLAGKNYGGSSMTAIDEVQQGPGAYDFALTVQPQNLRLQISVRITNLSGIRSNAVTINGTLQNPQVQQQVQNGVNALPTQYLNLDSLVNIGLSASQIEEFQSAISKYDPSAGTVTIVPDSVHAPVDPDHPSLTQTVTFVMTIDHGTYSATLKRIGILQAELQLTDPNTAKQVFDSGILGQGN